MKMDLQKQLKTIGELMQRPNIDAQEAQIDAAENDAAENVTSNEDDTTDSDTDYSTTEDEV